MRPPSVALIAALPREIAGLVRGTAPERSWLASGVHLYRLREVGLVAAGMGAQRVSLAVQAACSVFTPDLLVSVGLAGACDARLSPGDVLEADLVVDAGTGERFRTAPEQPGSVLLASTPSIANVAEKARLRASYGAALVDMEAATVARLAAARGLPCRAIKGVSDASDFEVGDLDRFADGRGQFRTAAFAVHTALHPSRWLAAAQLGRNSTQALKLMQTKLRFLFFD